MRMLRWIAPLAVFGLTVALTGAAPAQEHYGAQDQYVTVSSANFNSLIDRIEALETAVTMEDVVEEKWESVHDEKWSHKIGGRIMWDYVNFADVDNILGADNQSDYWEFRRVRIFLQGEGYGMYEYKLQFEFEPEGEDTNDSDSAVSFKDMYLGLTDVCLFNHLRFGHQFEFHGLENHTSSKYITFMERYAATAVFTPERNVGIQAFDTNCDQSLAWQYGAFFPRRGTLDETNHETIDDNQGIDLHARVCASPYYCQDGRHCVHVGAGVWYSQPQADAINFRIRPGTHEGTRIINATSFALGDADGAVEDFITYNVEAAAVWGPLSLQGEYFYLEYDARDGVNAGNYDVQGAYAYVSYFLTGENRVYDRYYGHFGRVKPHTNFWAVPTACDGCCIGSGAWELAARWQWYDNTDDPALDAGEATGYTVGVNWYMNPYVRTMFNYEHWDADYNDGTRGELDWLGMRVQWDF